MPFACPCLSLNEELSYLQENEAFTRQMAAKSRKIVLDAEHGGFEEWWKVGWMVFYETEQGRQKEQLTDAKNSSTMWKQGADQYNAGLKSSFGYPVCFFQSICLQNLHQLLGRYWGNVLFICLSIKLGTSYRLGHQCHNNAALSCCRDETVCES